VSVRERNFRSQDRLKLRQAGSRKEEIESVAAGNHPPQRRRSVTWKTNSSFLT